MKQEINPLTGRFDLVNDDTGFHTVKVSQLPETGEEGTMYVVESEGYSTTYVRSDGEFIMTGSTAPVNQVQSDWEQTDETQVDYIMNKPELSSVATSGDYEDLTNKPTIPDPQVQSDWNQTDDTQVDFIKNKPIISNEAFKPFLSTFNTTGTTQEFLYSISSQNLTVGSAYLGQVSLSDMPDGVYAQGDVEVYIYPQNVIYAVMRSAEVSPYVWEVNSYNNRGREPMQQQSDWNQSDNTKVDYIKNKPTIPAAQIQSDWTQSDSTAKDYIKNKPTIPTVNDGTLTVQKNGTTVDTFSANSSASKTINITVPVNTSELNNNSGFITNTVNNLQNYYTSTNTYTKTEVDNLIQSITTLQFKVVSTLPVSGQSNVIYLLQVSGGYEQWIYSNSTWTKIGTTAIDLSNYIQKTDTLLTINGTAYTQGGTVSVFDGDYNNLTNKPTIPAAQVQSNWTEADTTSKSYIQNKPSLSTVATSGNYNDLSNKPTIPAAQIQSDWSQSDTTKLDYIKNKPTIPAAQIQSNWNQTNTSAVDYIKNKPSIPTVNNATLTIQKNGTTVNTFTANSNTNKTANITVPTKTSELVNDSGFITSATPSGEAKVLDMFVYAYQSTSGQISLSYEPKIIELTWTATITLGMASGTVHMIKNSNGKRDHSANNVTYYYNNTYEAMYPNVYSTRGTHTGTFTLDSATWDTLGGFDINFNQSGTTVTISLDNSNSGQTLNAFSLSGIFYY